MIDIKEIREFGHTWYTEGVFRRIDERADVWLAINVLKKRHLAISNKSITTAGNDYKVVNDDNISSRK